MSVHHGRREVHAPSSTSDSMLSSSNCLRVIGNHPRRTPTSHRHNSLNIQPIPVLIRHLTDKFCVHCPSHPNPLVQQRADRTNLHKKYKHKHTKHKLLYLQDRKSQRFLFIIFHCRYLHLCLYSLLFYDMIYLLTTIGLSPGGSSTVHIYTQTMHRTIQNKQ